MAVFQGAIWWKSSSLRCTFIIQTPRPSNGVHIKTRSSQRHAVVPGNVRFREIGVEKLASGRPRVSRSSYLTLIVVVPLPSRLLPCACILLYITRYRMQIGLAQRPQTLRCQYLGWKGAIALCAGTVVGDPVVVSSWSCHVRVSTLACLWTSNLFDAVLLGCVRALNVPTRLVARHHPPSTLAPSISKGWKMTRKRRGWCRWDRWKLLATSHHCRDKERRFVAIHWSLF